MKNDQLGIFRRFPPYFSHGHCIKSSSVSSSTAIARRYIPREQALEPRQKQANGVVAVEKPWKLMGNSWENTNGLKHLAGSMVRSSRHVLVYATRFPGTGVRSGCVHVTNSNDDSMMLQIIYGGFHMFSHGATRAEWMGFFSRKSHGIG